MGDVPLTNKGGGTLGRLRRLARAQRATASAQRINEAVLRTGVSGRRKPGKRQDKPPG